MAVLQTAFDFEPPRADLQSALRDLLEIPLRLTFTNNRRTMISLSRRPGLTELRLHHMFLEADPATVRAVGRYVMRDDSREVSAQLGGFIAAHRERIREARARKTRLSTSGVHHDLLAIYHEVNRRYFEGQVDAVITWGRAARATARPGRRMRRSIKLGSYCSRDRLIRVHPALDTEEVPRFFVEYIVYHEMLHHVLPPTVRGGRRQLHDAKFKQMERAFPLYQDALRWEALNVRRLLRS
jgi:hypothetical protein